MNRSEPGSPRCNRVTPFGDIVVTPSRGTFMGNRGCLHDDNGQIVRHAVNRAWITCTLEWRGVRRRLMAPGRYTELFFLDEATALAAGHRPCGECRPERLQAFKEAWGRAHGLDHLPKVAEIDAVLAAERGRHQPSVPSAMLPDGVIVTGEDRQHAWILRNGHACCWAPGGYGAPEPAPRIVLPLTPNGTIAAIRAGYRVEPYRPTRVAIE